MSGWIVAAGSGVEESTVAWVLIDVAIILVVARLVGALFRRIGQPPVVGEILAGLMLGPLLLGSGTVTDLLGLGQPLSDTLFPTDARPFLKVLAELGLVIFMFVVGLELDLKLIRGKERLAAGVSVTSVVLPFALGFGLAWTLHETYLPEGIDFLPFGLFVGASMSVTAFPVLARILTDRRMQRTPVGAVTLACAAIDDILAWSLLALVIAVVEASTGGGGGNPAVELGRVLLLTMGFGAFMTVAVRPLLVRLNARFRAAGQLTPDVLGAVLALLLASAWATSLIGIHSIFGAFVLGAIFPREGAEAFTHAVLERIESVAVLLLLPLFFIVTGLDARVGQVSILSFLGVLAAVVVVACVGKFVGATVAGRIQGMSWRRSAAIGTLMNTRGLTELVLLSIGRDKGVLDDTLFTALVLMAIITTVMTSPLLKRIYPDRMVQHDIAEAERAALGDRIAFRVLVAIDEPERAEPLVDLACGIALSQQPAEVVLTSFEQQESGEGRELSSFLDTIATELDALGRLEARVRDRGLSVQSFSQRTESMAEDIAAQTARLGARLVLVGDRRDDPDWVATVAALVAAGPADVGVVVAPLPRPGAPIPDDPPVVEVGDGPGGVAALEYGVRLALPSDAAPTLVGVTPGRGARRHQAVLDRLAALGHPGRSEAARLDTVDGARAAAGARAVVRPFAGPEGLEPVERARPDAERLGCPVLLVAPDPNQIERSGLDTLLDEAEPTPPTAPSRPPPRGRRAGGRRRSGPAPPHRWTRGPRRPRGSADEAGLEDGGAAAQGHAHAGRQHHRLAGGDRHPLLLGLVPDEGAVGGREVDEVDLPVDQPQLGVGPGDGALGVVDGDGQGQALLHRLAHLGLAPDHVVLGEREGGPVLEDEDAERRPGARGEHLGVLHHGDAARRAEPRAGIVEVAPGAEHALDDHLLGVVLVGSPYLAGVELDRERLARVDLVVVEGAEQVGLEVGEGGGRHGRRLVRRRLRRGLVGRRGEGRRLGRVGSGGLRRRRRREAGRLGRRRGREPGGFGRWRRRGPRGLGGRGGRRRRLRQRGRGGGLADRRCGRGLLGHRGRGGGLLDGRCGRGRLGRGCGCLDLGPVGHRRCGALLGRCGGGRRLLGGPGLRGRVERHPVGHGRGRRLGRRRAGLRRGLGGRGGHIGGRRVDRAGEGGEGEARAGGGAGPDVDVEGGHRDGLAGPVGDDGVEGPGQLPVEAGEGPDGADDLLAALALDADLDGPVGLDVDPAGGGGHQGEAGQGAGVGADERGHGPGQLAARRRGVGRGLHRLDQAGDLGDRCAAGDEEDRAAGAGDEAVGPGRGGEAGVGQVHEALPRASRASASSAAVP